MKVLAFVVANFHGSSKLSGIMSSLYSWFPDIVGSLDSPFDFMVWWVLLYSWFEQTSWDRGIFIFVV